MERKTDIERKQSHKQAENKERKNHLLCERNFPVAWPDPSHPGIGHLKKSKKVCRQKWLKYSLDYTNKD